jgi:hypothetical protein
VDPRAGLDDMEKRKFLTLPGLGTPTLRSSNLYPVAIPTELSWLICLCVRAGVYESIRNIVVRGLLPLTENTDKFH